MQNSSSRTRTKELSGIRKLANRAKNQFTQKKLRDCRAHLTDTKPEESRKLPFITGEILHQVRLRNLVMWYTGRFSLRGKPLNSYGMNKNCL
jgi:hypothetical protein